MRTLSRPMFNMGGPIKQGIMHGIREPHKHGGKAALVGNPAFPKDKTGRAHHVAWFAALPWLARAAPMAWRGFKAARTFNPALKGLSKWKNILPSGRFRTTTSQVPQQGNILTEAQIKAGMIPKMESSKMGILQSLKDPRRFGAAIRENPVTALSSLTLPATGIDLAREHGKDVGKGALNLAKRFGAAVVPGDQSHWYTDPDPATNVPLNPNLQKLIAAVDAPAKEPKKLSETERKAFANKQRNERVQKYLDMMGYDRSKKTAIADALIDASKIVGDRGTLDRKNITRDLINPIIQATSKRLDKPGQIREAVGLMATKAEIEKDLSAETDALDKEYKRTQIAVGKKSLERGFEKDMGDFFLGSRTKPDKKQTETYARIKADEYGLDFTKVTDEKIAAAPEGASEKEIIQSVVGDDGIYMVGNALIKVTGGVPKVLIGA